MAMDVRSVTLYDCTAYGVWRMGGPVAARVSTEVNGKVCSKVCGQFGVRAITFFIYLKQDHNYMVGWAPPRRHVFSRECHRPAVVTMVRWLPISVVAQMSPKCSVQSVLQAFSHRSDGGPIVNAIFSVSFQVERMIPEVM